MPFIYFLYFDSMLEAPVFQVVVVGSGGGPDETNLSAYLLKLYNANWEDGVIGLEAGSGQGALARLLRKNPSMLDKKLYSASEIYSFVRCFLITHAHLDHINSLIISAGSLEGPRKRVYGIKRTLEDLELIFADRIWPNLASWKEEDESIKLLYSILTPDGKYNTIYPAISVRTMPLNHGTNALGQYNSAAYFIRHDPSHREFLFFGDVEPDSLTVEPLTINVWRVAAPKIPAILSTIFIECSWPSGRPDELLFGHLTPEHLADELSALATEVIRSRQANTQKRPLRKRQKRNSISPDDLKDALVGLTVYVMHCKDDMHVTSGEPTRDLIVEQVRCIIEERQLGAKILAAEQGACITI